jgi:hypothetical protein
MKQRFVAAVLAACVSALAGCANFDSASSDSASSGATTGPRSVWSQDPLYGAPPP